MNFAEPGVRRDDRSILELNGTSTIPANFRYGATSLLTAPIARTGRSAERFSLAYVTGTHNFKFGVTDEQAFNDESRSRNNAPGPDCTTPACDALSYDFSGGRPSRIQYYAQPYFQQVSYAIGRAHPTSIAVETFGTGSKSEEELLGLIRRHFDLRPGAIIANMDLLRPIYRPDRSRPRVTSTP